MDAPERFSSAHNKAIQHRAERAANLKHNNGVVTIQLGATPSICINDDQRPPVAHNGTQGPERLSHGTPDGGGVLASYLRLRRCPGDRGCVCVQKQFQEGRYRGFDWSRLHLGGS